MADYKTADTSLSIALQAHTGLGVLTMGAFTILFARSYQNTKSEKGRTFKALPLVASFFKTFYYIILLIIYSTQDTSLQYAGPIFLQFFSWFVTTPPILAAIALLETNVTTDILYLCTMNSVMIISGYYAHVATHLAAIWSFYGFGVGCAYFVVVDMFHKYTRVWRKKERRINETIYMFLCIYTLIVWGIFPISFILYKTDVVSYEVQTMFYVYLDVFAKGLLGMILVGARDMMDNKRGRMVRFTNAIVHVYTPLKSLTQEETVTDVTDDGSLTPPPSLDMLTPAEKDFITGKTPNKPHTIIPIDDSSWTRTSRNSINHPTPQKKIIRSHSSPQLNRGRA